jgi:hypothetical protein
MPRKADNFPSFDAVFACGVEGAWDAAAGGVPVVVVSLPFEHPTAAARRAIAEAVIMGRFDERSRRIVFFLFSVNII